MQPITVTITVEPRDIPNLVCSNQIENSRLAEHIATLAEMVAETLGIREFLSQPDRVPELRRLLWEQSVTIREPDSRGQLVGPAAGPM